MTDRIPLYVVVEGEASEEEDYEVPGTYLVLVDADLDEKERVSAALDIFHANVAIGMLDDFAIWVADAEGNDLEEDPDYESGSLALEKRGAFCGTVYEDDADENREAEDVPAAPAPRR